MDFEGIEANYIAGTPYVGANVKMYAGPGGNRGEFTAWDPVSRQAVWKIKETFPVWSGALATAGDVVFYGTMDGWFKAVDARDRRGALAVQDRLRDHRPAGHVPRAGRQAVRGRPLRRRRLGRRHRVGRPRSARPHGRARLRATRWRICRKYTTKGGTLYVFALP